MTITTDEREYDEEIVARITTQLLHMIEERAINPTQEQSGPHIMIIGSGIPNLDALIRQIQLDERMNLAIVEFHEAIDDFSRVELIRAELPKINPRLFEIPVAMKPYNYTEKPKRTGKRGFNSARNRVIT